MEKRIELEKRGRNCADITELNLDNCRSTNIVGLTDSYVNLEILSLINVGLTSLKGFPKLPKLKKLELSDNRISGGLDILETSPHLRCLNLSGNKLKDFDALEPLKNFKELKTLDLYNNEATATENYREKIFKMLPSLKYLDGADDQDQEADDSDAEEEVNGNDGNDEDSAPEEISSEGSDDEESHRLSLDAVYSENLDDLSDEDDYEVEEEEIDEEDEDDDDDLDGDDEVQSPNVSRGKKRKHEDGDEN